MSEGAVAEAAENKIFSDKQGQMEQYSLEELYIVLSNLLENENYESAGIVRDIISKKQQR